MLQRDDQHWPVSFGIESRIEFGASGGVHRFSIVSAAAAATSWGLTSVATAPITTASSSSAHAAVPTSTLHHISTASRLRVLIGRGHHTSHYVWGTHWKFQDETEHLTSALEKVIYFEDFSWSRWLDKLLCRVRSPVEEVAGRRPIADWCPRWASSVGQ